MRKIFLALAALLIAAPAFAQQTPFVRLGATITLSVSTSSADAALVPTNSPNLWVCNTGATLAYVGFGDSSYAATTADTPIPAGLCGNLSPNGKPYIAALTATSTTTLLATPGLGSLLGAGGGSGSGGGGSSSSGGGGGLANFLPNGNFGALTAGSSSTQVTAPTGASIAILNTGSTPAYILQCTSSSCTATSSDIPIAPFSPYVLEAGTYTNIAAIDPTGTSNLTLIGGSDLYQVMLGSIPPGAANIGYMPPALGAASFTLAQVSVASTATVIAAARTGVPGTGRVSVTITNTTTTAIYLGGSGVTTSTGTLLPGIVGASVTINTQAAVYGIVATGTAVVTEFETY